ncbi:MAG: transporter [Elusimicrobia bacterium]|nr:transporter [Elusimicrobiota bacterium]MBU2614968.1 transporter [Elusimicrobiota bacterium]
MKKSRLIAAVLLILSSSVIEARVNFIEQWKPGIDTNIIGKDSYDISLDMTTSSDERLIDSFSLPAVFTYSPFEKAEFATSLGAASYGSETGVSDLSTGLKYNFMKEDGKQQPSISGEFGFVLPTADYRKNLGLGGIGINFDWIIQKTIRKVKGHLLIGYEIHTENPDDAKPGNEFHWNLGGEYTLSDDIEIYGSLKGINHAPAKINGQTIPASYFNELYLAPGIKYQSNDLFDFYFSPYIGLTDDSYNLIFFAGMGLKI